MNHSPLGQFEISPIFRLALGPVDLSVTNASLAMLTASALCMLYCILALRKPKSVPSKLQSSLEIMNSMVERILNSTLGNPIAKKFVPLIFSIFLFTLTCNLMGALPRCFAATGQIVITFALASIVFAAMIVLGFFKHGVKFFKIFVPAGCPSWIAPIMIPVELFSFLARPVSLSLRLAANIVSGHVLLHVLAGATIALLPLLKPFPFVFIVILSGAELCIAVLQAYIFTVLSCVYLAEVYSH
jgi:F-type H+-transporting ATPase subunit a